MRNDFADGWPVFPSTTSFFTCQSSLSESGSAHFPDIYLDAARTHEDQVSLLLPWLKKAEVQVPTGRAQFLLVVE